GSPSRGRFEVVDALMSDPDQMLRAVVRQLERELSMRVALGARRFLHSFSEFQQDDVITGRGLVVGFVSDRAGDIRSQRGCGKSDEGGADAQQTGKHESLLLKRCGGGRVCAVP